MGKLTFCGEIHLRRLATMMRIFWSAGFIQKRSDNFCISRATLLLDIFKYFVSGHSSASYVRKHCVTEERATTSCLDEIARAYGFAIRIVDKRLEGICASKQSDVGKIFSS